MRSTVLMMKGIFMAFGVLLATLPLQGWAQDTNSASTITLDAVVVTATKTHMDPDAVPFSYYSVTKEEDQKRPGTYFSNVGEMVRDLPGVHVGQFYPWGMAWVQLRGTGNGINRTVHMVDGLPIYVYQASTLNTHDISRVDVLLGPSSALYGANASGGVVNMITQSGYAGMGATVEFAYGSQNTYRPHVHLGDAVEAGNGTLKYYFSYSGDISDGYVMQPYDEMVRTFNSGPPSLFSQVQRAGIEDNNYRFHYMATRWDWESNEGVTLSFSANYADRWLSGGQPGYTAIDDGKQWITSFRAGTPVGDWGDVKLSAGYQQYEAFSRLNKGFLRANSNSYDITGFDPSPTQKIIAAGTGNREQIPADLQLNITAFDNNTLTLGAFYSHGKVSPGQSQGWTQIIDPTAANYGDVIHDFHFDETQYSFYLQDTLMLMDDRLSIVGGLRYDHWTYDHIYNSRNTPNHIPEASFDNVSYRLGAKHRLTDNWGIRAAYGTAYWQNPQYLFASGLGASSTVYRVANHDLDPEKTWMGEAGVDFAKPEWGTRIGLTAYYGRIKDVHGSSATATDVDGTITGTAGQRYNQYRNFGKAKIKGLEVSVRQDLVPDTLYVQGALTFNHSRIADDANPANIGNHLSNAPDFSASAGLYFTSPALFNASLVYRHTDDRYYDNSNNEYIHYHMGNVDLLDVKIWRDWTLAPDLTLTTQVSCANLTDQDYEALYTYMGPGRHIEGVVSLTYAF